MERDERPGRFLAGSVARVAAGIPGGGFLAHGVQGLSDRLRIPGYRCEGVDTMLPIQRKVSRIECALICALLPPS